MHFFGIFTARNNQHFEDRRPPPAPSLNIAPLDVFLLSLSLWVCVTVCPYVRYPQLERICIYLLDIILPEREYYEWS